MKYQQRKNRRYRRRRVARRLRVLDPYALERDDRFTTLDFKSKQNVRRRLCTINVSEIYGLTKEKAKVNSKRRKGSKVVAAKKKSRSPQAVEPEPEFHQSKFGWRKQRECETFQFNKSNIGP